MKLHEVPNGTYFRVIDDNLRVPIAAPMINKNEIIYFDHIDGMYSYCKNNKDEIVHLVAWADVEIVENKAYHFRGDNHV